VEFEVRDVARSEDEIERPVPRDLVGDVEVAALRVMRLGNAQKGA
jgi:hypothetical protein